MLNYLLSILQNFLNMSYSSRSMKYYYLAQIKVLWWFFAVRQCFSDLIFLVYRDAMQHIQDLRHEFKGGGGAKTSKSRGTRLCSLLLQLQTTCFAKKWGGAWRRLCYNGREAAKGWIWRDISCLGHIIRFR